MAKRTSINLDMDLVAAAARELGTSHTTETVHAALLEIVIRGRRARLARRYFEDLAPEGLEDLRRARMT
ncbi:MAG: type II toxin-antitoxin system VapB family antitoxin [Sporichthyaceae bacterium]